jgi:DNA segregation ATPase FtsK/SpoIIIE, S-DNA-T family
VPRLRLALPSWCLARQLMSTRLDVPRISRPQFPVAAPPREPSFPTQTGGPAAGRGDPGTRGRGEMEEPNTFSASPRPPLTASPPLPRSPSAPIEWRSPALDVFQTRTVAEVCAVDLDARSRIIEETLASFNIEARVVEANQGPAVTQFGIEPAPGIAVSRILSRQNDLALRLGASPIRLEAPVPGKSMVGVEVPNASVATVTIRDAIESPEWERGKGKIRLALGRDVSGKSIIGDLGRMPHLLIAGATGAGKSVCINTIVGSLLYQFTPDELQLLMIDPKRVELVGFADIPHLRLPVVTDMDKVVGAMKWVVLEMDRRYKLFAQHGVRNLEGYNRRAREARRPEEPTLPFLVVVVDELADMMMTAAEEVEKTLCRLAQLARATGIHLVVATQRPSVDVLTGLIKANFPTRIAFAVSSQTDSRVILDQAGAEKLLGRGDALYMPTDAMKPVRLQGAYVSDEEMQALVAHWKVQGGPRYTAEEIERIEALGRGEEEDDDVYDRAVELAEAGSRLSVSLLQRRLGIGQARAQRLHERLADEGYAEG